MSAPLEPPTSPPSISSAEASPVRTCPSPAREPGSPAPGPASGASLRASSARSGRGSSSSRTSPAASADGCPRCGVTCTCSDTLRLPSRFLPSTSERPTAASACSLSLLPTPTATSYGTQNNGSPGDGREAYATKGRASLETLARRGILPTPIASLAQGRGGTIRAETGTGNRAGRILSDVVKARSLLPGTGLATAVAGTLSPRFVEWLMGFPDGWTDCEPLAMPLFPSAPRLWDA